MKPFRVNNSARANFGFFLTPTPDNDPKSFHQEHELLGIASQEAFDKLKEFKIRPRTFLTSLALFDRNVIGSVKNKVLEYVNTTTEEVRQASPLVSQFVGEGSESAVFAYASAVSFACMKKYAETIEFKKRQNEEPIREGSRKNKNGDTVNKRKKNF
jgi:hypothetical protein